MTAKSHVSGIMFFPWGIHVGRAVETGTMGKSVRLWTRLEESCFLFVRREPCFWDGFVVDMGHRVVCAVPVTCAWTDCSVVKEGVENLAPRRALRVLGKEGDAEAVLQGQRPSQTGRSWALPPAKLPLPRHDGVPILLWSPAASGCPECARRTSWTSSSDCVGRAAWVPRYLVVDGVAEVIPG